MPSIRWRLARPGALKLAKASFTLVALLAMALAIAASRDYLVHVLSSIEVTHAVTAIALWTSMHFLSPGVAMIVLGQSRHLPYRDAFVIHASRLPSKYLPGGIWHTVARVADLRGIGYSASLLGEFVLIENAVAGAIALCLGGLLTALFGDAQFRIAAGVVSAGAGALLLVTPLVVRFVCRRERSIPLRRYGPVLGVMLAFWIIGATSFIVFATGLGGDVFRAGPLQLGGAYLLAWGIGFVTIIAPQGVGVAEYVAATLLSGELLVRGIAIMASFRLVALCADLIAWGISMVVRRSDSRHAGTLGTGAGASKLSERDLEAATIARDPR